MTRSTDEASAEASTTKWLLAFVAGPDGADETVERVRPWAEALACKGLDVELEWLDAPAHERFTGSSQAPPFCAFVALRIEGAFEPSALDPPTGEPVARFRLRSQPVFDRIACEPGKPTPGLKKTTLWRARPDLDEPSWQERYAAHAALVPQVHASAWRYCQNVVESSPAEFTYHAVSELWWPAEADLLERFYASEEARALVAEDTRGFIDIPSAVQTVTRHWRLSPVR